MAQVHFIYAFQLKSCLNALKCSDLIRSEETKKKKEKEKKKSPIWIDDLRK